MQRLFENVKKGLVKSYGDSKYICTLGAKTYDINKLVQVTLYCSQFKLRLTVHEHYAFD
jgi:hypothetical protein